jgi:hypothetical protein
MPADRTFSSTTSRRPVLLPILLIVIALMLTLVESASAAQPKTGHFASKGGDGGRAATVDFDVAGAKPAMVKHFAYTEYTCGTMTVKKAIKVNGKGKFQYDGAVTNLGGLKFHMAINGKFVTKTKANVSLTLTNTKGYRCEKGKVSFVATQRK